MARKRIMPKKPTRKKLSAKKPAKRRAPAKKDPVTRSLTPKQVSIQKALAAEAKKRGCKNVRLLKTLVDGDAIVKLQKPGTKQHRVVAVSPKGRVASGKFVAVAKEGETRTAFAKRFLDKLCPMKKNPAGAELIAKREGDKLRRRGFKNVKVTKSGNSATVTADAWKRGPKPTKTRIRTMITVRKDGKGHDIVVWHVGKGELWKGRIGSSESVLGITTAKARDFYPTKAAATVKSPKLKKKLLGLFANPKPKKKPAKKMTKKQLERVSKIFQSARRVAAKHTPEAMGVKLVADPSVHDSPRHFAMTGEDRKGQVIMHVAPEISKLTLKEIRGIIFHEFGHAIAILGKVRMPRSYDAIERQADKLAEKTFKTKIFYNEKMIEEAGRGAKGKRPRPKGVR